jgi:hypothetical protein
MKHALFAMIATLAVAAGARAIAPGPIDGVDIPLDFADSPLVGLQTNRTGVGDVTDVATVITYGEGTELDALYLAKDSQFLYVGLTGNLLDVGNPFIVLIDNPFDFGQTELRTEGVGGPPFALQLAGREVLVDTNGTPNDGSDDTYSVPANSGTLLPDCGEGGAFTGWDYALAIDGASGTMFAHEYILFGVPIAFANAADTCHFGDSRGRVPCDPTPDNAGDPGLPIYATRNLVASSPIDDGNEIFEGGAGSFGYQRGGFINANTTGVTEVSAAQAADAATGVEISIPLANIGDSGLFGSETINLMVITMDADEFQSSTVSDGFGAVLNQALPALTGSACTTPQSPGLRPDLSAIASCLSVDLSALDNIDLGAVLEGDIVATDYDGDAPTLVQSCPTSAGDQARDAVTQQPVQDGSELNALYADNDDDFLYLGITGNLESDGGAINIFVDADAEASNGDVVVSDFGNFALDGTFETWSSNGVQLISGSDDYTVVATDFGGGFEILPADIDARGARNIELDVVVNPGNLADVIRVVLTDADGTSRFYDFAVPGSGALALAKSLDDFVPGAGSAGTIPGFDWAAVSAFQLAGGFNNGNPGLAFDVTFDHLALTDNGAGQHVLDFSPPSAFDTAVVTDFGGFTFSGIDGGAWNSPDTQFITDVEDFTIVSTGGFGSAFTFLDERVDARGAVTLELDVTVNPMGTSGTINVVLSDGDDTQLRWGFPSVGPGAHTLTSPYSSGVLVFGGADGSFDLSDIFVLRLQASADPTDITFENLQFVTAVPSAAAISTMTGNELPNNALDVLGNGAFLEDAAIEYDYAYSVNLSYGAGLAFVDFVDLVNSAFTFRGAVDLDSGASTLMDDPFGALADNPNGMAMAFNNTNTNGVIGCADTDPCFEESADTVAARAETADTGVELAIPLADLGLSPADLPRVIRLWTMVGTTAGVSSDQSLPSMRNVTTNGNQVLVPGEAPVNFTNPSGGPDLDATINDFSFFTLTGAYGTWSNPGITTFTSGPDDFTVDGTDFGGGFFFGGSFTTNGAGATAVALDVTLNPANQADRLSVVLFDGDNTVRVYTWSNLTNGAQTLVRNLNDFSREDNVGAIPGFDPASIGQFNLEGGFNNGNPGNTLDVTFERLYLIGEPRNYEARAARICLGTIAGDADCDGDNDLRDFALLQQCVGVEADPVLPMECAQLDFVGDRTIDAQDQVDFVNVLTGP